jgi:penicillin-binding protein 2
VPTTWHHPHELARRTSVATWTVCVVLACIGLGFFRLQVLGKDRYAFQSQQNRVRPITLPAPRGLIVDRHGVVLADNVPGHTISVIASSPDSLRSTVERMAPFVGLDSDAISEIISRPRPRVDDPVVVMRDAPFDVVAALEERRVSFPGLHIQAEPKRRYPHRGVLAHVVGYVNEITEAELSAHAVRGARYGALVGRSGLERQYDDQLRGEDGRRYVEVDALGRTVREDGVLETEEPRQGQTLNTTIDLDLQEFVSAHFPEGKRGAVLAMDPRNGDVLALYSAPTFDPNVFVGGVEREAWETIRNSPDQPLLNRAVQGRYPPASPWKLAIAAMALRRGLVTMRSRMPLPCHGGMAFYTRYFRCWSVKGHGSLTLAEAIQHSCDVYFYQLGLQLGLQNILADGNEYGFSDRTGIDLPNEIRPTFPASTAYYDQRYGPRGWTRAVALNLAIGQGENDQTLINMVRFYVMMANDDGRAPHPRLIADTPPRFDDERSLALDQATIYQLRQALVLVVEGGTAQRSRVANLRIAGKTGTAQNPSGPNHGWFIAFAPADDPQIVVGAIVEFGRHGSDVAPIVTSVIAHYVLGGDDADDRPIRLVMPADSAPQSMPLTSAPTNTEASHRDE